MYLQNAQIYYAKYKKEEIEVKALMELIKEGVAEVKKMKMRSVTLEHCFGGEETQETIQRKKIQR